MHIAIIGCGNMGVGLAERLIPFHQIFLYDCIKEKAQQLAEKIQGKAFLDISEAIEEAELIFLCVKPQNLNDLVPLIQSHLKSEQIVVSLLAGTPLDILEYYFPQPILVRIMPNLAMCYGAGIIGIVDSPHLNFDLKQKLQQLFIPLGKIYWLKESQVDALTSLASSGPAFILTLIEAMIEAGIGMGFQADEAQNLVLQMIQGCLTLIQETKKHPTQLKWKITSPSGTTIAGLRILEKEKVRSGVIEAFLAAYQRAQEIATHHKINPSFQRQKDRS